MIFTLYYMYATFLQWWRLGSLRNKLGGTLNSNNALLICDDTIIFDTKKTRSFENLLFRNDNRIGCTVVPKQKINLSSQWVIFPRDTKYFPIHFKQNKAPIGNPNIYVLVQAVLNVYQKHQAEILQMENFGELIAWKVTDHFEAILRTDMDKLTKLIHCFSQSNCDINHELQLLKIETVDVEGKAKKIKFERQFSKDATLKYSLAPVHWRKFVSDIKDLYSKIRDATNPKITIDNGTPKPEDLKKVPVSEVKPIKKDKKQAEDKDKHTLEVNCSDYRRHKSSEHSKKDKDKSAERHKPEKEKSSKKESPKEAKEEKDHKARDHKKHKSKEEVDSSKHKKDKEVKAEGKNELEQDTSHKKEALNKNEAGTSKRSGDVKNSKADSTRERKSHKTEDKHKESSKSLGNDKNPEVTARAAEDPRPGTSGEQKTPEKLCQESRTSSKEKKLVRSTATCDDAAEEDNDKGQGDGSTQSNAADGLQNKGDGGVPSGGENGTLAGEGGDVLSPSDSSGCIDNKYTLRNVKPPNILVYADSTVARDNVKEVLGSILNRDKYVIYDLPLTGKATWADSTALVVVCGAVDPNLTSSLMKFLLNGGQLLCLCSDLLYSVLHTFTTAEVREHELVRFSYDKWKNVKMMHHIFCYQASPAKKQFSKDSDASNHSGNGSSPIAPRTPSAVEIKHGGKDYTIQVQVLGAEETWQTPSLLLATVKGSEGRSIFSQVHLEIDPNEFIEDENKFAALKDSNQARLEILNDILSNHLDLDCENPNEIPDFTPAYFLGRHDLKLSMLGESHFIKDNEMKAGDMHILFCGKDDRYDDPCRTFLPVLIHACPQNFNTVSYFETLDTKYLGRLVIYSDVLASSQSILSQNHLTHGVAVICRQQLRGVGRSNNVWLSPPGCAMFSLQLHISSITNLGKSLALVQHLQMVAVVKAVKRLTGNNKNIKLGIKWPNDLYVNGSVKIGGIVVTSTTMGDLACVNVGLGVNLSNTNPTTCINQVIQDENQKTGANIPEITHEKFFAQVFNETEKLINRFQIGDVDYFFDYYYEYWLHNDCTVTITSKDGKSQKVRVVGIDDSGFLRVRKLDGKITTVQPDGNSFDMMKGLIYPKNL